MKPARQLWPMLLLTLAWLACTTPAHAGVADAPGSQLEVYLLTYGPGAVYWERFGHDAIEIRDRVSGQAVSFNYGVFDFAQKDFLLNFARGHMRYSIAAELAGPEMAVYREQGRSVRRQKLALSASQAAALRDYLLWNLRPENRQYDYDYYTRNCATRVRDALDQALGGLLKAQLAGPSRGITYRGETDRLMAAQPWLMLLMDMGLSGHADKPLSAWQSAFIPMHLAREISHVRLADGSPLVQSDQLLSASRLPAPLPQPPDLLVWLLPAGIVIGLLAWLSGRARHRHRALRIGFGLLGTLWLLWAGLAGLFMAVLWAFTLHRAGWANENLLLFNPLALLLIPCVWQKRPGRRARRWLAGLSVLAGLALLAKLLPGFDQHNLPWIGLALPAWLGLLAALQGNPHPRAHR